MEIAVTILESPTHAPFLAGLAGSEALEQRRDHANHSSVVPPMAGARKEQITINNSAERPQSRSRRWWGFQWASASGLGSGPGVKAFGEWKETRHGGGSTI